MGIEEILKRKKKELKITNAELARMSNVPLGTINKIMAGATLDPKFETIKNLCAALGISMSDLEDDSSYYLQPDAALIAQEVYDNPELRLLFDAARDVSGMI